MRMKQLVDEQIKMYKKMVRRHGRYSMDGKLNDDHYHEIVHMVGYHFWARAHIEQDD